MRSVYSPALLAAALLAAVPASAQVGSGAKINELARTPLVRVSISESLRTPPDEAILTVGTEAKAPTATAAVAANRAKTESLLAVIRAAGVKERAIQTQGVRLSAAYRFDRQANGQSERVMTGYQSSNSIRIKTSDLQALTSLLDKLAAGGADSISGPYFDLSDRAPLRREARARAMERGRAEATEHARNNGFGRVTLLSVEEGTSYRGSDYVVMASRSGNGGEPVAPPPPPPPPPLDSGSIAPGQVDTGVTLNLLFRMER